MALHYPSLVIAILALLYTSTFLFFAIIRILFGVSIQRLWWSGLRRISFTPREGVRLDIRGIGFSVHRPTFALPTWFSVVVTELKVTVDLKALNSKTQKRKGFFGWSNGSIDKLQASPRTPPNILNIDETEVEETDAEMEEPRSRTWQRLTQLKERIKRLHRQIQWIRMVDVVANSSSLTILDVGAFQLANFTMAVDTRRKTVDRSRLFQHRQAESDQHRPVEWIFTARNLLFNLDGEDANELLDHATLNIHGLLSQHKEGLRDASIALKLGRLRVDYDDLLVCSERMQNRRKAHSRKSTGSRDQANYLRDIMEELEKPGSQEEDIVQTVSDSKEFVSSILRGVQEMQFAVGFIGVSKQLRGRAMRKAKSKVYVNMSMKEVGLDLLRLDQGSPAHLMYFSRNDVAHQALVTAISISVGLHDGHDHRERLLYVPMVTATLKSTLPSKTIQLSKHKNVADRNTNILFANLVVTSPSIDLDPKHLPFILAITRGQRNGPKFSSPQRPQHHIISRLLPKATVKISIHEPVVRVALPCTDVERRGKGDFDLLISAMSSMALDVESSHSATGDFHYSLNSNFRITTHQLYYQTAFGEKHNLLMTDSLEIKTQISASPEIAVVVSGNAQTFSVYMVSPEISEGVRQIVAQLRSDLLRRHEGFSRDEKPNLLRRLPNWLLHVQLQGSDFNFEVAGIDPTVSASTRGTALHLGSWTAEYKANRHDDSSPRSARRRAVSRSINNDDVFLKPLSPTSSKKMYSDTDNRRLAIHTYRLEGFVIESADACEPEPFMSLPRYEIAFSTSTDQQGPLLHVNCFAKSFYFQYSLYRHYAIGVAAMILRKTFTPPESVPTTPTLLADLSPFATDERPSTPPQNPHYRPEVVTFDLRAGTLQLKCKMPADPPLMLQVFSFEAGRHRWATPFIRAHLLRLYAETPNIKAVWSRMLSVRLLRLDLRQSRRKLGVGFIEDKSVDIVTDAIRISVPHLLVVHKVIDNLVNVIKTTEQLHHRFETGTEEYILVNKPKGPKQVPKVSLRSQAFLFEIEDGAFDWRLGVIYLQGLREQKQRLAREEAFRLKAKKIKEADAHVGTSRYRGKSSHHHPSKQTMASEDITGKRRSRSSDAEGERKTSARAQNGRRLRYNTEGIPGLSNEAKRTIHDARAALDRLNAHSWKTRIQTAFRVQKDGIRNIRQMVWGSDDIPEDAEQSEDILAVSCRPALMSVIVSDLHVQIDKPSFPLQDCPLFMHKMGKGMPLNQRYSLLVPMHLSVAIGEARMNLRDYPLPVLHVPAIRAGQSPRLPSLSVQSDFVIAEEYRDNQSIRHAKVVVVPAGTDANGQHHNGLKVDVRRTVSAVKTYSSIAAEINTSLPTRITWGTSYQPAIQDMMQVIENFTKPPVDPSERIGFWDKIRLSFHSSVSIEWKGDGDIHFVLKGSRDPYLVTGSGAGFVMCWRSDVKWKIAHDPDPKKFMIVDSGEYVLAVPDFSHYVRRTHGIGSPNEDNSTHSTKYAEGGKFKKTVMKLSGNVRWLAGLVFERNTGSGGRSFKFKPHYEVVLKNPEFAQPVNCRPWDAYRGFRSHHIHLSVAIAAPHNRDWTVTDLKPSTNYNSVHLTPRLFTHFFDWWSMFSGVMSLPIRQGKLFPGVEKSSKKFGRHLATIKYSVLLSPLYLSHIYKHKDAEEYGQHFVSGTGLKLKLDSFLLDLHQRREEVRTVIHGVQGGNRITKTSAMRINQAQLDFVSADVRAVSARIAGTSTSDIDEATDDTLAAYEQSSIQADLSRFIVPDNDTGWVDMDDFVELDWILPTDSSPDTKILPLAFTPRFTYFRNSDHHNVISGDPNRSSPFGNEPTHFCLISKRNDPRRVQCDLIQDRLNRIAEQLSHNKRAIGDHELRAIKSLSGQTEHKSRLEAWQHHHEILLRKEKFLQSMHKTLLSRLDDSDHHDVPEGERDQDAYYEAHEEYDPLHPEVLGMDSAVDSDDIGDFNNRFIIHNVQLKWNNSLRDIILRYIHQVSQRRGFVYYMSRRAVKFILDIVDEQNKAKSSKSTSAEENNTEPTMPLSPEDEDVIQDRIRQMLNDGKNFVEADDPEQSGGERKSKSGGPDDKISRGFTAQNAYYVRLVAPQIQLQSEKNTKSAVLVTAKGIALKVVQIMDKDRLTDEISGLVQRRFTAGMDSVQIYVTSSQTFSSEFLDMYSANRYGAKAGSSWPPWVPLEVMHEPNVDPYGFSRVVERTSARMRFDKFNTLRLKYNDDVTTGQSEPLPGADKGTNRIDHLWVNFPQLRAICDSTQYYALYIMVLDLLLYSEPSEKTRNETLEKIMLASDFSDLSGAPEMVIKLQEKIRTLTEIKLLFQVNGRTLSRQQWKERILLEQDLANCDNELFFIMKAITTSQRRYDERAQTTHITGLLHWEIFAKELVWHLLRGSDEHLIELQLRNAVFNRTDNSDGSNENFMEIGDVLGYNLLPNATYPQIIAPFEESVKEKSKEFESIRGLKEHRKILKVHWLMLESIAGIPVMERFEVSIHPLRIQLEREVGMKVFEYIFPGMSSDSSEDKESPFMVKHALASTQEEDGAEDLESSPAESLHTGDSGLQSLNDGLTGAGDISFRLQPTMTLPINKRPRSEGRMKASDMHGNYSEGHRFRISKDSNSEQRRRTMKRHEISTEISSIRPGIKRQESNMSVTSVTTEKELDLRKRFTMHRANDSMSKATMKQAKGRHDDLNEMLGRASKYMTLAYVRIPSMVLCLSYKGKGQRNIVTDVHDLVFRMPTLEYRNKTWSNLDLFLQLKKEVVRALVSHTGAIIGNKFSHIKPNKVQQMRLRELASSSVLLGSTTDGGSSVTPYSDTTSSRDDSVAEDGSDNSDILVRPTFGFERPESDSGQNDSPVASRAHSVNGDTRSPPTSWKPWTSSTGGAQGSPIEGRTFNGRASSVADSESQSLNSKTSLAKRWTGMSSQIGHDVAGDDTEDGGRKKNKISLPRFLHSKR